MARCQCQRDRIIAKKLARLPERYRACTLKNFVPIDGHQQRALDAISADFTGSYLLVGDYGRGKTHLAAAQYSEIVRIERPCLFVTMAELLHDLRKSEMDLEYFCEVLDRSRYAEKFHLFIDDVDKFKVTEHRMEKLFEVLNGIYSRDLGLTVTTNFTIKEMRAAQRIDGAVLRRISDICKTVHV